MIRFIKFTIIYFFLISNVFAGSSSELNLPKKNVTTRDCFETLNRATFKFNQGLDKVILKPVAEGYRSLPTPIKKEQVMF